MTSRLDLAWQAGPVQQWGNDAARWSPELAGIEDAYRAWQIEFDRLGLPLVVLPRDVDYQDRTATVAAGGRRSDLSLGMRGRSYYLALRRDRSTPLQGFAPDLATAARVPRATRARAGALRLVLEALPAQKGCGSSVRCR